MNIQIFGKPKCFDSKQAERWFKERRIKYQYVDLKKYGISRGELTSVKSAVGLSALMDEKHPDLAELTYLAYDADRFEKLLEEQDRLKTPIVRNGKKATVGYCPEVWATWEGKSCASATAISLWTGRITGLPAPATKRRWMKRSCAGNCRSCRRSAWSISAPGAMRWA